MGKALVETETKKTRMAMIRRITQKVCREMYQADPSGFTWLIRKGLFPGFDVGKESSTVKGGN
jgi:hypothetical protein